MTSPTALPVSDASLVRDRGFADGAWLTAPRTFAVRNPATGALLAQVADLGPTETEAAVAAASRAQPAWAARTAKDRSAILRRWFDLIIAAQDDLAVIMTAEQGKPLAEARGEVVYGAAFIEWFAEEAKRTYGEVIPTPVPGRRLLALRQPVGVVAAITPWNFPIAMLTRKAGPALAAGCTFVVKPAHETPLSALALAVLAERAGVPAGVFNVITSTRSSEVGKVLTESPLVRKFSFTGSTAVGKLLMAQCASTVKRVSLELGGNAPFVVFDDADLDSAVAGAVASRYRNAGQTCVCANRFLVQSGVVEEFTRKLAAAVAALPVGDGRTPGVVQGPLISERAVEKVERLVSDARAQGAHVVCGGARHALGGTFFEPTVLSGVTGTMAIAREEIFGPVSTVIAFRDEAEAIAMANDTPFGLAAYAYTRDLARAWRVAERLEYGMVGINEGLISTEVAPFGGVKESGIGREGARQGIEEYLEIKFVAMGGLGD
ncbi:MAG: NAD-dependent succinate-semialdehyde dehydrogenase [Gemmatimonadetes bacterium]|nr:NAD-dependent succinate-semialdehyde dehydrogenase [Gemmatimonadota bacterium]